MGIENEQKYFSLNSPLSSIFIDQTFHFMIEYWSNDTMMIL